MGRPTPQKISIHRALRAFEFSVCGMACEKTPKEVKQCTRKDGACPIYIEFKNRIYSNNNDK